MVSINFLEDSSFVFGEYLCNFSSKIKIKISKIISILAIELPELAGCFTS